LGTGCPRSAKKQVKVSTCNVAADGFLTHSFLPLYRREAAPSGQTVQQDFFRSLDKLAQEHGFTPLKSCNAQYPYNVLLAFDHAQQQVEVLGKELSIRQATNGEVYLMTKESIEIYNTLYYLPVLPLYRMLQDKKQKRTGELLLSVCAYLYAIAGVPYYRDENSYIGYMYNCMADWYSEIDIPDENDNQSISELRAALHYGSIMERKLYNPYQLNNLPRRIDAYRPTTEYEYLVLKNAKAALHLLNTYPNQRLFSNMTIPERKPSDEYEYYDDEVLEAWQYISFVAQTDGLAYSQMEHMINDEFGNYAESEMPILTKCYDNASCPGNNNLDFERLLFALLDKTCYLLNNTP